MEARWKRYKELEAEVARLTEERDSYVRRLTASDITWSQIVKAQREDIQRLLAAVEAVCAKACLTGRKGEDGWTYQVGKDGDAALRALAAVRDEFDVKYPKGAE